MKSSKGFTIIELIVVIAIIAVLASIVAVSVTVYIKKSKTASVQTSFDALPVAALEYEDVRYQQYPGGLPYIGVCGGGLVPSPKFVETSSFVVNNAGMQWRCVDPSGGKCGILDPDYQTMRPVWAVEAKTSDNVYYCMDSKGRKNNYILDASTCSCRGSGPP